MVSIFINTNSHPNLFKSNHSVEGSNQSYFKRDYLKELLAEQNQMNHNFQKSIENLQMLFQRQQFNEENRWKKVVQDMELMQESNKQFEEFEKKTREWLMMLERNSQELHRVARENSSLNQGVLQEIHQIQQSNEEIMRKLMTFDTVNEQLSSKMAELSNTQQSMAEHVADQNGKQEEVIDQLENQEALMEKSNRQLSNLRSILYERSGFIADKIEENYKLISSSLYKFLTGTEKPLTLMMTNQNKRANKHKDQG